MTRHCLQVEIGKSQRPAGRQTTDEMAVAAIERKSYRSATRLSLVPGQMRRDAVLSQGPFQPTAQSVVAHFSQKCHARAERRRGQSAVRAAAADGFSDKRDGRFAILEQAFVRPLRRRFHVAVDVADDA
jgi:hypothetical protein